MEAKIEALEPRTSRALFFLLGNHIGNQHIASQRAEVTGSDSMVFQVIAVGKKLIVSHGKPHSSILSLPKPPLNNQLPEDSVSLVPVSYGEWQRPHFRSGT